MIISGSRRFGATCALWSLFLVFGITPAIAQQRSFVMLEGGVSCIFGNTRATSTLDGAKVGDDGCGARAAVEIKSIGVNLFGLFDTVMLRGQWTNNRDLERSIGASGAILTTSTGDFTENRFLIDAEVGYKLPTVWGARSHVLLGVRYLEWNGRFAASTTQMTTRPVVVGPPGVPTVVAPRPRPLPPGPRLPVVVAVPGTSTTLATQNSLIEDQTSTFGLRIGLATRVPLSARWALEARGAASYLTGSTQSQRYQNGALVATRARSGPTATVDGHLMLSYVPDGTEFSPTISAGIAADVTLRSVIDTNPSTARIAWGPILRFQIPIK